MNEKQDIQGQFYDTILTLLIVNKGDVDFKEQRPE